MKKKSRFINEGLDKIIGDVIDNINDYDITKSDLSKPSISFWNGGINEDAGTYCYQDEESRDADYNTIQGLI